MHSLIWSKPIPILESVPRPMQNRSPQVWPTRCTSFATHSASLPSEGVAFCLNPPLPPLNPQLPPHISHPDHARPSLPSLSPPRYPNPSLHPLKPLFRSSSSPARTWSTPPTFNSPSNTYLRRPRPRPPQPNRIYRIVPPLPILLHPKSGNHRNHRRSNHFRALHPNRLCNPRPTQPIALSQPVILNSYLTPHRKS